MIPLKVLVVDDSALYRRALVEVLRSEPQVQIVGEARDGSRALAMLAELKPDLITLDVEMPELDGLSTLREIRGRGWRGAVLMISAHGGEGKTVEALCLGAQDFIVKPAGGRSQGVEALREVLMPKVLQFCRQRPAAQRPAIQRPPLRAVPAPKRESAGFDVVVIGVSTGGPNALGEVIPRLPADLPASVLVVQHMPAVFTRMLADRLSTRSRLRVREAREGEEIRPGTVLLAPGDYHLEVRSGRVHLQQEAPEHSCRPAADVLFRSAAAHYGSRCLGVVLTGMGRDGVDGCRSILDAGGLALVQNQASCVVWGMPKLVYEAGLADSVVPLADMASTIDSYVRGKERR